LAVDEGDNRSVEEGEALGETGMTARYGPGVVAGDFTGATGVSVVGRPEFGDMVWMDFGGGDICGFRDESCGLGSNPKREDRPLDGNCLYRTQYIIRLQVHHQRMVIKHKFICKFMYKIFTVLHFI
jgi:hypothetical protein